MAKRSQLVPPCSVKETDWRAELEAFGKGVAEDATEVQRQAQDVAREGAIRLEHLPQQAAKARLPHVDPEKFKSQIGQASFLGQQLVPSGMPVQIGDVSTSGMCSVVNSQCGFT